MKKFLVLSALFCFGSCVNGLENECRITNQQSKPVTVKCETMGEPIRECELNHMEDCQYKAFDKIDLSKAH